MTWTPRSKNQDWLRWCLERIEEAPYDVTARWTFYRLIQEWTGPNGESFNKKDYKKFLQMLSKARKNCWDGWRPSTLKDDTRNPTQNYTPDLWYSTSVEWFDSFTDRIPAFDFLEGQENIVMVAYEAKAMSPQFRHYLDKYRIMLIPFGGDASIEYKWRIACKISDLNDLYPDKTIYLLYFGDLDKKGMEIPENAMRDIVGWSNTDFEYRRVGLDERHITEFNIQENPDAPGKYQWESLDEEGAEALISKTFDYFDIDAFNITKNAERRASEIWNEAVSDAIEKAKLLLEDG